MVGMLLIVGGLYVSTVKAAPSTLAIQTSAVATTSVAYLTSGTASSTYQIDSNGVFSASKVPNMQGVDSVSDYIQYAASSTSAVLTVVPQWSNNNIDWYGFNQATNATPTSNGATLLASTTLSYQFLPTSTATSSIVINLPNVGAQHERVIYGTTGANGAVYSEYDLKLGPETP